MHLGIQFQHPLRNAPVTQPADAVEWSRCGGDRTGRQPVAGGSRQQDGIVVQTDPEAELRHQPGRERVIGEDQFGTFGVVAGQYPSVLQRGGDASRQLGRGLACEGESEDLLGPHLPRAHQPHDACRHDRGLAGACPCDDDCR